MDNNEINNEVVSKKKGSIGIIIFLGVFTGLILLYLLIKFIFKPKQIKANELEDSFRYKNQGSLNNQDIMNSIYIAKDWADIYRITQDLINGKDPLYGKRQEVIKHIELRASSVDDIINDLVITVNGDADLTDQKY